MKGKILKVVLPTTMALIFSVSALTGCTSNETAQEEVPTEGAAEVTAEAEAAAEEVIINYPTFAVGSNASAPYVKTAIENFNKEYDGKIEVVVEEIPGDQAYVDKMKLLLSTDDLPDIVYTGGYNMLDPALEKDAVLDLTPYIDEAWKATQPKSTWDFNSRDGKIYAVSEESALIGYFYNKEMFEQVGITPAKTWDEFFANCDKLKAVGITPLSMDTADSGWITSLWLTAVVGSQSDAGMALVNDFFPTNYNTPEFINGSAYIQKMFMEYTTPDAIGGKYENGANNFISGQTAMIANGPWMITDFQAAGIEDNVAVAMFPGNGVIDAPNPGYFVASKDPVVQQACVEFIRYMSSPESQALGLKMVNRVPSCTTVPITDEFKQANPLLSDVLEFSTTAEKRYNNYQSIWYPNVIDGLSVYYPELATGTIAPEEFAANITEIAAKN